ncbi:hypothetical protein FOA52_000865 [Chlamydomonas sp. UWO 241]|nr:hypothetical protein FOA52_000865 [Chlamydomonas sp. UWO 241]
MAAPGLASACAPATVQGRSSRGRDNNNQQQQQLCVPSTSAPSRATEQPLTPQRTAAHGRTRLVICCEFAELATRAAAEAEARSSSSRPGSDSSSSRPGSDSSSNSSSRSGSGGSSSSGLGFTAGGDAGGGDAGAPGPGTGSSGRVGVGDGSTGAGVGAPPRPLLGDRHIRKEVRSLVKQIEMSVGANRRAAAPFDLHVTSWEPGSDVDVFGAGVHCGSWDVTRHAAALPELFPLDQVVMLSPDAPEPLSVLEPGKVYCIGGIVDRSVCKGVTAGWAAERGVTARRLPVQEHADALGMGRGTTRSPVLNVSDVVVALLEFAATGDWAHALRAAIPGRKLRATVNAKPKRARVSRGVGSPPAAPQVAGALAGVAGGDDGAAARSPLEVL